MRCKYIQAVVYSYWRSYPFSIEAVQPVPLPLRTFPIAGIFTFVLFHRSTLSATIIVHPSSSSRGSDQTGGSFDEGTRLLITVTVVSLLWSAIEATEDAKQMV